MNSERCGTCKHWKGNVFVGPSGQCALTGYFKYEHNECNSWVWKNLTPKTPVNRNYSEEELVLIDQLIESSIDRVNAITSKNLREMPNILARQNAATRKLAAFRGVML